MSIITEKLKQRIDAINYFYQNRYVPEMLNQLAKKPISSRYTNAAKHLKPYYTEPIC